MTDRASLFKGFLKKAAKQFNCKPTDMPAQLAATRWLTLEVFQSRLLAGKDVDATTFRWLAEQEMVNAPPPEIPKVRIQIVNPAQTRCPKCAHVFDPESPRMPDPLPPPPPSPPSGVPVEGTVEAKPAAPPPAANVVALRGPDSPIPPKNEDSAAYRAWLRANGRTTDRSPDGKNFPWNAIY